MTAADSTAKDGTTPTVDLARLAELVYRLLRDEVRRERARRG